MVVHSRVLPCLTLPFPNPTDHATRPNTLRYSLFWLPRVILSQQLLHCVRIFVHRPTQVLVWPNLGSQCLPSRPRRSPSNAPASLRISDHLPHPRNFYSRLDSPLFPSTLSTLRLHRSCMHGLHCSLVLPAKPTAFSPHVVPCPVFFCTDLPMSTMFFFTHSETIVSFPFGGYEGGWDRSSLYGSHHAV